MMQTSLANGDVISVGQACIVTFFASSLTAMLSDAPPEVLNNLAPVLTPLAAIIGPDEWPAGSDPLLRTRATLRAWRDTGPREDGGISVPDPQPPWNYTLDGRPPIKATDTPGETISNDEMLHRIGGQE